MTPHREVRFNAHIVTREHQHIRGHDHAALPASPTARTPRPGAARPDARSEYATRDRPFPVSFKYGVTVNPSKTTGRTGAPSIAFGGTGCTGATIFTLNVRSRASGSKSITSTVHTRIP